MQAAPPREAAVIPWELLDAAQVPGSGGELHLYRRGEEFSIRVGTAELMNSRAHGSEEALAELACARVAQRPRARVLIGGLGMGYTLAAALHRLGPDAEVTVAELVPEVVRWNRGPLAPLAGRPLDDARVRVLEADVAAVLRPARGAWDAVLLDVDNGPEGLTRKGNDWLYCPAGLAAMHAALRPGGVLAVWSATASAPFAQRLRRARFAVQEHRVRARGAQGGGRHTIWIAARGA